LPDSATPNSQLLSRKCRPSVPGWAFGIGKCITKLCQPHWLLLVSVSGPCHHFLSSNPPSPPMQPSSLTDPPDTAVTVPAWLADFTPTCRSVTTDSCPLLPNVGTLIDRDTAGQANYGCAEGIRAACASRSLVTAYYWQHRRQHRLTQASGTPPPSPEQHNPFHYRNRCNRPSL
jgi:hypothetical protein